MRLLLNGPKSDGADAIPHGAFSTSPVAKRFFSVPLAS
jgi:hypothetical protein